MSQCWKCFEGKHEDCTGFVEGEEAECTCNCDVWC